MGKSIQDNWEHVDSLLSQFNEAVVSDGWEGVMDKIQDVPWIDSADPAKQTVVAYLPDEDGEPGASITLEVSNTVHQNAQRYFEEARSQKNKAKGAETALASTEKSRERAEKQAAKDAAAGRLRAKKRSKRFWFERHRWAILSGGHLLIGGRDAKGNDVVVRKHLTSNDLYFHADLHGRLLARSNSKMVLSLIRTHPRRFPKAWHRYKLSKIWVMKWKMLVNCLTQSTPRLLKLRSAGLERGVAEVQQQSLSMQDLVRSRKPLSPESLLLAALS